jgi:hypothetical protein
MTKFKLNALPVSRAFHILLRLTDSGLSIVYALVATNTVSRASPKRNVFGDLLERNGVNHPAFLIFGAALLQCLYFPLPRKDHGSPSLNFRLGHFTTTRF